MTLSTVLTVMTLIRIFEFVSSATAVLFIIFSYKRYNEKVSIALCILAVFFPLIAVIVHLSKRKHFQGEGLKVCPQCGEKLPPSYEVCSRCLAELAAYDESKSGKSKKLSDVMLAVFSISKAVAVICILIFGGFYVKSCFDIANGISDNVMQRISVTVDGEERYYDKKGKAYLDPNDVVIYAKDGTEYIYDEDIAGYVSDRDEEYPTIHCYVDSDGWFYFDDEDTLNFGDPETDAGGYFDEEELTDMKIEDLFAEIFGSGSRGIWYDDDGNVYYPALSASWNEKGELIMQ